MNPADPLVELDRAEVARFGLRAFVRLAWRAAGEPGAYLPNWHLDQICQELEAVSRGESRRLAINIPPGCGKSLICAVLWPAWDWIEHPERRWIWATYGHRQTLYHARRFRDLVCGDWYQARWPLAITTTAADEVDNSRGGFRFSTSVGGAVTGRHADIIGIDDISKVQDAYSSTGLALEEANTFCERVITTRQTDPTRTAIVKVGQRIGEADVFGRSSEEYHSLIYPMRGPADPPGPGDMRGPGELLWPARYPDEEVARLEAILGPMDAAAQLQQCPTPPGGAVFRTDWLHYYDRLNPHATARWFQSWDMAFKGAAGSDFVVGQVWAVSDKKRIVHQVRGRWDFPATCDQLLSLCSLYPDAAREVVIEDAANGPAVEAQLRSIVPGIKLVKPLGGKLARANAVSGLWAAGDVELPEHAPWLADFVAELLRFTGRGGAEHDDQVDAMTQALAYVAGSAHTRWAQAMRAYQARQQQQRKGAA